MKRILPLIIIVLIFISCSKKDRCGCFDSNGEKVVDYRSLDSFNELEIDAVFDVNLHLNDSYRIEIETGKNLLKGIETTVLNNRLYVKNHNKCNWARKNIGKITLNIYCDTLSYIKLWESCDFRCLDTIKTQNFTFDNFADISSVEMNFVCNTLTFAVHAGTGKMNIKGSALTSYLWSMGYSVWDFNNFNTDYCFITSKSTGNCYINVNKELEATLFNSGDIYYSGNPYKISVIEKGSGKLLKIN